MAHGPSRGKHIPPTSLPFSESTEDRPVGSRKNRIAAQGSLHFSVYTLLGCWAGRTRSLAQAHADGLGQRTENMTRWWAWCWSRKAASARKASTIF